MARLTENDISGKGKAGMNGAKQVLNDIPGIDDVKDSMNAINADVRKVKEDAGLLAESVRDAATGTIRRGQDYMQSGIDTVKQKGSKLADKASSLQDMPLRKAVYGIIALCALSFLFGRSRS